MPTPKSSIDILLDQVEWELLPPTEESDIPYATHSGIFRIGNCELKCYRLNTGQAIFDADDFLAFLDSGMEA